MSKKLFLLICFVLVLCLGSNVLALDMVMPDFAGGEQTAAVLWEFEDGNSATGEASDKPSLILYDSDPPDACFGFRTYGSDYEGGCDPNNAFHWDSNGTVVIKGEESVAQPIPLGDGANLTVQVQVTWQGPNFPEPCGPGIGFELWGGYPERPNDCEVREGEWLGGVFNEEAIEVAPIAEVNNVEGAWRHTTYLYTFSGDEFPEETTHFNVLFFGFVSGTAGMRIDEVVIDMVVHDGEAPTGPGRPWMLIPRAGQVRDPVPANRAEHIQPNTDLSWVPDPCLAGPLTYDVWFGTDPCMANNPKIASNIGPCTVDPCAAGDLAAATLYYWRVDTSEPGREGIVFKFTTWGLADDVYPVDGAKGVDPPVLLEWGPDGYAASCDIYLGTSFAEVDSADSTDTTGIYKGPQAVSDANYNVGMLDLLKDYYWRIDEVSGGGTAIKGDVWKFTTGANFTLEDFDRYATSSQLWDVWDDYWVNGSNSQIFLEKDANFTLDGNSLMYEYDSGRVGPSFPGSVADADIADMLVGSDWTIGGIKSLVIHFMGKAGNSTTANDRMWLELEDTSSNAGLVLYDGDMNNLAVTDEWQEWNIDLGVYDACGVDLTNVDKIHLGFAGEKIGQSAAGGTGTVYFDEIELHPRRCRPEVVAWDIAGDDCKTDGFDLEAMSADWLVKDYEVIPVAPDRNDLLVEYLFDTDYSDTSGNGFHGQPSASLTHVANGYLTIEAAGGHVDIPFGASNPFHGPNDFSVVMEYRSSAVATMFLMTSTDPCLPTDWDEPNVNVDLAFETWSPMGLIMEQEQSGGPSNPDDLYFVYDQFFVGGTDVYKSEAGGIGAWHTVAATYDADGGICPPDGDPNLCPPGTVTGLVTVYIDGIKGGAPLAIDPNIPQDPNYDIVRIGDASNPLHADDWGSEPLIGDFNEILIFDAALTEPEVYYLSGIVNPTYVANTSLANVVPKSPPGAPYDPNNIDIVNFIDFNLLGEHWLEAPLLWP